MDTDPPGPPGPNVVTPVPASRAGRDLTRAVPVGVALVALVVASIAFYPRAWYLVAAGGVAIGTWEVFKRLRQAQIRLPVVPLLIGGQATVWASLLVGAQGAFTALGASVMVCMVWRLFLDGRTRAPHNYLRDTGITVFVLMWIALPGACGAMLSDGDHGAQRVIALILLVVCSDVGGYVAGVLFGKHPMAPAVSPKKSWEGFAGSLVFAMIGGATVVVLLFDDHPLKGVLFGVLAVFTATLGDLVESQVKRDLGIKDMGTMLPGHGGLMDRLDSVLPTAVWAWIIFTYVVPS